jgi:hypothetical protein
MPKQDQEKIMPYRYSMVQIPPNVSVRGAERGQEAAQYLQNLVNEQVRQGWEFYPVDEIGVEVRPGCLFALIGQKATYTQYYVVTF